MNTTSNSTASAKASPSAKPLLPSSGKPLVNYLLLIGLGIAAGGLGMRWWLNRSNTEGADSSLSQSASKNPTNGSPEPAAELLGNAIPHGIVSFPTDQWKAAGIEIQRAILGDATKSNRLTGKVSLNEDRIAHIYSMVEGTIDAVSATLGQAVKANDLLMVIQSREIGKAKLDLYQARLALEIAQLKLGLQSKIAENTRQLLHELRQQRPIQDIEEQFRSLTMGDYRERLLASYAGYLKSQSDVNRLEGIKDSGAVSGKLLMNAQANRNIDLATFQARIEQIEYEVETQVLLANQMVKEAETRVAVDATSLRILGCSDSDIASIDPANQGQAISNYPIRAPFDGTVIAKDCALREQVRPSASVFTIADLSTVWITADVFEENVPLLSSLEGSKIQFTNSAWPERVFEATVFFTGEIMDEKTRTISLKAVAENPDRLLKPGLFVDVLIPSKSDGTKLMVPANAIQEHEGKKFVFLHLGGDRFERRDVEVAAVREDAVVVRSGIQPNDPIVVRGGFILKSRLLSELLGEE
ncbi:MAG: efflux RND transporter periplasmic adaptor subunit [Planctomycetota bacterium]